MRRLQCTASALKIRDLPSGADTGRRIIKGQVVEAHGESYDGDWAYVVAPTGSGWSGTAYLTPATAPLAPQWPAIPNGLVEIRNLYGEPGEPACYMGVVHLPDALPQAWGEHPLIDSFSCHVLVEGVMTSAFNEVHRRGLWDKLVDYGGCYNYRKARGLATKISTHAWGISLDLNVKNNPLGGTPNQDPGVVGIFADHGFVWGAKWSRPDPMHWQLAARY